MERAEFEHQRKVLELSHTRDYTLLTFSEVQNAIGDSYLAHLPLEVWGLILSYCDLALPGIVLWIPKGFQNDELRSSRFRRAKFVHLTGFHFRSSLRAIRCFDLFRINRSSRAEARSIFFSQNKFLLLGTLEQQSELLQGAAISNPCWEKLVDPAPLGFLRELHIHFDTHHLFAFHGDEQAQETRLQYRQMISLMERSVDLPRLRLGLHFDNPWGYQPGSESDWLRRTLWDVVDVFAELSSLRALMLFFGDGWGEYEVDLEQMVIGREYDSKAHGKERKGYRSMFIPAHEEGWITRYAPCSEKNRAAVIPPDADIITID